MFTDFNDQDDNKNKNDIKVMNQNSLEFLNFTNLLKNFKENIIEIRSKLIPNYCKFDTRVYNDVEPNNLS